MQHCATVSSDLGYPMEQDLPEPERQCKAGHPEAAAPMEVAGGRFCTTWRLGSPKDLAQDDHCWPCQLGFRLGMCNVQLITGGHLHMASHCEDTTQCHATTSQR